MSTRAALVTWVSPGFTWEDAVGIFRPTRTRPDFRHKPINIPACLWAVKNAVLSTAKEHFFSRLEAQKNNYFCKLGCRRVWTSGINRVGRGEIKLCHSKHTEFLLQFNWFNTMDYYYHLLITVPLSTLWIQTRWNCKFAIVDVCTHAKRYLACSQCRVPNFCAGMRLGPLISWFQLCKLLSPEVIDFPCLHLSMEVLDSYKGVETIHAQNPCTECGSSQSCPVFTFTPVHFLACSLILGRNFLVLRSTRQTSYTHEASHSITFTG